MFCLQNVLYIPLGKSKVRIEVNLIEHSICYQMMLDDVAVPKYLFVLFWFSSHIYSFLNRQVHESLYTLYSSALSQGLVFKVLYQFCIIVQGLKRFLLNKCQVYLFINRFKRYCMTHIQICRNNPFFTFSPFTWPICLLNRQSQ